MTSLPVHIPAPNFTQTPSFHNNEAGLVLPTITLFPPDFSFELKREHNRASKPRPKRHLPST